jgi:hypothetical protein
MIDGLQIHIQNRMMKPPAIALSGVESVLQGGEWIVGAS